MKSKEEYPLVLKAQDVAEIMGVSKRVAYDIMDTPGFPKIQVRKFKWVAREAFFTWLEQLNAVR